MTRMLGYWKPTMLGLGLVLGAPACTVTGVGVGYDGEVDYAGDFYEPYGYEYGGWERGYRVGPRGGDRSHGPGSGGGRPYRAAPPSRSAPSIPGRSRGR